MHHASATSTLPNPVFEEVTEQVGLKFFHFNGMTGELLLPEIMGPGAAFLDYDNDGDLDIYLVQGATYPSGKTKKPLYPLQGAAGDRLFRNNLLGKGSSGILSFSDVTAAAGIKSIGFGLGVACGDFNNDGFVDLYVTKLGGNTLLVNQGNGRFKEGTQQAGVDDDGLSSSALFVDFDGDGFLDLFVVNYINFSAPNSPKCYGKNSALDYCGPDAYDARGDRIFRNKGDGTFQDMTRLLRQGVASAGLGVVTLDADGDGRLDIYVANDGDPNHLWHNKADGSLEEIALFSGVALNGEGVAEAGMGVSVGDFDRDGDEDIFLTHLEQESNTLYVNDGSGFFDDGSSVTGLALPSMSFTGFGARFFDLQNDGLLDLLVLNGAVRTQLNQPGHVDPYPLKQTNLLFQNVNGKRFHNITAQAGPAFHDLEVSRAAVLGDVNNDGAIDLLITNNHGKARLLLNRAAKGQHWLGLRVMDRSGKRAALGALLKLTLRNGAAPLLRRVNRAGSYLSSHDPRCIFGLHHATTYTSLEVIWPDGFKRVFPGGPVDTYRTITRE